MSGIQYLTFLWILFVTQSRFVRSEIQFLERSAGESVVFPCVVDERLPPPYGVYLKRSWLQQTEVLYMYTESEFHVNSRADKNRVNVSGDPSNHSLAVTISQLRASDTDRYFCEFIADNPASADDRIRGKIEFFLLVSKAPALVDIESVQLFLAPGPGGLTYDITLQQLQPESSGWYRCQLLVCGRPDPVTSLGRRAFVVSVKGGAERRHLFFQPSQNNIPSLHLCLSFLLHHLLF